MDKDKVLESIKKLQANDIMLLMKRITELQQDLNLGDDQKKRNELTSLMDQLDKARKRLSSVPEGLTGPISGTIKGAKLALEYLQRANRKIRKTKFFDEIKKGYIHRQSDGTFLISDLDAYAATLPLVERPYADLSAATDRAERKEEAELRYKEALAKREEHKLEVMQGKYLLKTDVYLELAARALAFRDQLKNTYEATCLDLINLVGGESSKSEEFVMRLNETVDMALSEFAKPMNIEIDLSGMLEEGENAADNAD